MLNWLIDFSLRNRAMVLVAVQSALDAILGVLAEAFSELVDLIL